MKIEVQGKKRVPLPLATSVPIQIMFIKGNDFTHERLGLANHAKDCSWEKHGNWQDKCNALKNDRTLDFEPARREGEREQLSHKTNHVHAHSASVKVGVIATLSRRALRGWRTSKTHQPKIQDFPWISSKRCGCSCKELSKLKFQL